MDVYKYSFGYRIDQSSDDEKVKLLIAEKSCHLMLCSH